MEQTLELIVHGRGNAWPVVLGETHPFYDMSDPADLANASFSLVLSDHGEIIGHVLVDAGHGTIQSLITGMNRIPDAICLTHAHMDHTLAVDWVVQSYWRRYSGKRRYPVYATEPVYRFLVRSYPQLEELIDFHRLMPGHTIPLGEPDLFKITPFPVYHGKSAVGASMLLFETSYRKVLFTGDLFTPLPRREDYEKLMEPDLLVVDCNNRFPWPRTNHWSFTGHPDDPLLRSDALNGFLEGFSWKTIADPHRPDETGGITGSYFKKLQQEWDPQQQPFTILEFLGRIMPRLVLPVHYSGGEDQRHYGREIFNGKELLAWIRHTAQRAGIHSRFMIPLSGQSIEV
jgi:glyoxylase-like metal-dependent hydrolase (beta-lactamase superfamily II)